MQFNEYNGWPGAVYIVKPRKRYGFIRFMFDIFMVVVTYGLWLVWIFVREMRNR